MGFKDLFDKIGSAGVKSKPEADRKPKKESAIDRLNKATAPVPYKRRATVDDYDGEIKRALKKSAVERYSAPLPDPIDNTGCDICASKNIFIDTINGKKFCSDCSVDRQLYDLERMKDQVKDALIAQEPNTLDSHETLYDDGYNDGYAAMPPAHDDEEYMMGYADGEGDATTNKGVLDSTIRQLNQETFMDSGYACQNHNWLPYSGDSRLAEEKGLWQCGDCHMIMTEKFAFDKDDSI